jgi:hypothetical protein
MTNVVSVARAVLLERVIGVLTPSTFQRVGPYPLVGLPLFAYCGFLRTFLGF